MLRNTLAYYNHQRQSLCYHRRWFICFSLNVYICVCVYLCVDQQHYKNIWTYFHDISGEVGQDAKEQLSNFVALKMTISIEDIINLILIYSFIVIVCVSHQMYRKSYGKIKNFFFLHC